MIDTLIELQRLKRLDRTGWSLRGLPNGTESVAAHSFGVSVTAMLLADELAGKGVELNLDRLLRMALLHDWAEARVGDMPRTGTAYFGAEARKKAEGAAFADIVSSLGGGNQYQELYHEYESRLSLEARLVKASDVIDLLIQVLALERSGARGLDEFWQVAEQPEFDLEGQVKETVDRIMQQILIARKTVFEN